MFLFGTRMTFKFNRRFLGLGVSAVCVYFFATNSQVVWLYVISSFLVGAIPVGLIAPLVLMHREKLGYKQMSRKGFSTFVYSPISLGASKLREQLVQQE